MIVVMQNWYTQVMEICKSVVHKQNMNKFFLWSGSSRWSQEKELEVYLPLILGEEKMMSKWWEKRLYHIVY